MRILSGIAAFALIVASVNSSAIQLEKLMSLEGAMEARNAIGDLIAGVFMSFLKNNIADPLTVFDELSIPTNIETDSFKMTGALNISKATLLDHHGLVITKSDASIIPLGINMELGLRSLRFMCDYVVTEDIETTLFPLSLYGAGPFLLELQEMSMGIKVTMLPTIEGTVKIMALDYLLDIWGIKFTIDGFMSDTDPAGDINYLINTLLNSYATRLFNAFEAGNHDMLRNGVKDIANKILASVSWEDIIGNGTSRGIVPMTFPLFV